MRLKPWVSLLAQSVGSFSHFSKGREGRGGMGRLQWRIMGGKAGLAMGSGLCVASRSSLVFSAQSLLAALPPAHSILPDARALPLSPWPSSAEEGNTPLAETGMLL